VVELQLNVSAMMKRQIEEVKSVRYGSNCRPSASKSSTIQLAIVLFLLSIQLVKCSPFSEEEEVAASAEGDALSNSKHVNGKYSLMCHFTVNFPLLILLMLSLMSLLVKSESHNHLNGFLCLPIPMTILIHFQSSHFGISAWHLNFQQALITI